MFLGYEPSIVELVVLPGTATTVFGLLVLVGCIYSINFSQRYILIAIGSSYCRRFMGMRCLVGNFVPDSPHERRICTTVDPLYEETETAFIPVSSSFTVSSHLVTYAQPLVGYIVTGYWRMCKRSTSRSILLLIDNILVQHCVSNAPDLSQNYVIQIFLSFNQPWSNKCANKMCAKY